MSKNKLHVEEDEESTGRSPVVAAQVGWKVVDTSQGRQLVKIFESIVEANERTEAKLKPPKIPDPPDLAAGVHQVGPAQVDAAEPKWTPYLEKCAALAEGESVIFEPADKKFGNNLRAMLSMSNATRYSRWSLFNLGGSFKVVRNGEWKLHVEDPIGTEEPIQPAPVEPIPIPEPTGEVGTPPVSTGFVVFERPKCKCGKPDKHIGRCRGYGRPVDRRTEKIDAIKPDVVKALMSGRSCRQVAADFGIARQTVLSIRHTLDLSQVKCACGKLAGHRGWCQELVNQSPKRQEFLRTFVGKPGSEFRDEISKALLSGESGRNIAERFKVTQDRVFGIRQTLDMSQVKCPCGQLAGHRGRCPQRTKAFEAPSMEIAVNIDPIRLAHDIDVADGIADAVERMAAEDAVRMLPPPPPPPSYIPDDPPEAKLLLDEVLAFHAVSSMETMESDESAARWERANDRFHSEEVRLLAQSVVDYRRAKEITDRHMEQYSTTDGSVVHLMKEAYAPEDFKADLAGLYGVVHAAVLEAIESSRTALQKK